MDIGVFYMLSVSVRGGFACSFLLSAKRVHSLPMRYCVGKGNVSLNVIRHKKVRTRLLGKS